MGDIGVTRTNSTSMRLAIPASPATAGQGLSFGKAVHILVGSTAWTGPAQLLVQSKTGIHELCRQDQGMFGCYRDSPAIMFGCYRDSPAIMGLLSSCSLRAPRLRRCSSRFDRLHEE